MGSRNNHTHTLSRTTGTQSWNRQKKRCAKSGHPGTKLRRCKFSFPSRLARTHPFFFRQLGQKSNKKKSSRYWQNEILEAYYQKRKERIQRRYQGCLHQEKSRRRQEMIRLIELILILPNLFNIYISKANCMTIIIFILSLLK